jgi:hypothetical protein
LKKKIEFKFKAYSQGFLPFSTKYLGTFLIDLGTVYNEPDQSFFNKWGSLLPIESEDLDDFVTPNCNVKCDIVVQSKRDKMPVIFHRSK